MKKILAMLLLGFTTSAYGVVNINWGASAGFYFTANFSGILGDGTGHSTRAQLMYSPDNTKDDLSPSGVGTDNDVIWASVTITEDGVAGNFDDYACFAETYTGPFTAGYVYAVIFQDNVFGWNDWYYYTPMVALQDITGGFPQIIEMNTDLVNGNAIDSGPNAVQNFGGPDYVLTGGAGVNGTVSPTTTNVYPGDSADFVITADSYYRIASLTTNGTAVTGLYFDNNSTSANFTWSNVQADGALAATFTAQVSADPASTPYSWLAQYNLTNFNTDAIGDADLDGLQTWQEYIAGTDPTNPASSFCVTEAPPNVLGWNAVSGRVYSVYWTTNLLDGFQCLESNMPWTQGSFTNSTDVPCGFYKIDVRLGN